MKNILNTDRAATLLLIFGMAWTCALYWPGLQGTFLFDDYPNIVDNKAVQPQDTTWPSLLAAALSSPSSELKRPLASLSFAFNYLGSGLDPYWMKLTNLVIHLINGFLAYLLIRFLVLEILGSSIAKTNFVGHDDSKEKADLIAATTASSWMVLPINVTGVLYIVQRMESAANIFVLMGLILYISFRSKMIRGISPNKNFFYCATSLALCTIAGLLFKETAIMLPLYALICESIIYQFHRGTRLDGKWIIDKRIVWTFIIILLVPLAFGSTWLIPHVLRPEAWETRDFTLRTRLLSEARIVIDYALWTVFPTPGALSFYHDNFKTSQGLFSPPSTLFCILLLISVFILLIPAWRRAPAVSLGISLFLASQLLTGTVLPLELIYEHRNYFASLGLMLAIVYTLTISGPYAITQISGKSSRFPRMACGTLLFGLMLVWSGQTAMTAYSWGSPLRLAQALATRNPNSPRALYELGRTYIIYSQYDKNSPFIKAAFSTLEKAGALPGSSILPEQALIFTSARMQLAQKAAWWNDLIVKLKRHPATVQDESSLASLSQCAHEGRCVLSKDRMMEAFGAALSHPNPSARLLATYSEYAWNVLGDHPLGKRMIQEAISASPTEAAYRVTLIRMLITQKKLTEATNELSALSQLNTGGHLNSTISPLIALVASSSTTTPDNQ